VRKTTESALRTYCSNTRSRCFSARDNHISQQQQQPNPKIKKEEKRKEKDQRVASFAGDRMADPTDGGNADKR
jgi:hypothetical protein